jgi:hypothetical protein
MHAYGSWCSISQAHSGCMQVLALLVPCSDQHGAVRADHTGWALACLLVRTASSIHMQNLSLHHVCDWHVLAVFSAVACKVSGEGGGGAGGCLCVVLTHQTWRRFVVLCPNRCSRCVGWSRLGCTSLTSCSLCAAF